MNQESGVILITVDLEDWFQVENLRQQFPQNLWNTNLIRVQEPTISLLKLFKKYQVKATFFVLGWLAKYIPDLLMEIAKQGHEIASHGFSHELCYNLHDSDLLDDLRQGKSLLEEITGQKVYGYRAPSFSINRNLIVSLKKLGFIYDSSYNDFAAHDRYGSLSGKWTEVAPGILKNEQGLFEIPVKNLKVCGKAIPWGGGGYFRLIPVWLFNIGVSHLIKRNKVHLFYCHPWEFDPGQPRVKGMRFDYRFRHYVNLEKNLNKFEKFLRKFSHFNFLTCKGFLKRAAYQDAIISA